jgi:fructoselysine-6-P-deglycase FrlB-like protein
VPMRIRDFICEQPAIIERCFAAAYAFGTAWARPALDGIALVGSGSSFNALMAARPHFVSARKGPVAVYDPEDFVAELADFIAAPLVIVLSQSGASVTSIGAAEAALAAGLPVLAITAAPQAGLARTGAGILVLPVGDEAVGPKTKGFTGSIAILLGLAQSLDAPALSMPPRAAWTALIETARAEATKWMASTADADILVFAGRRALHGVALEASLKVAEISGVPTAAFPTEELLHGRLHGLTSRSVVFMLVGGSDGEIAEAERVVAVMARHSCRVEVVVADRFVPSEFHSQMETPWREAGLVVPFQWLAVMMAEARGLTPETMRYGALSTHLAIKNNTRP